MDLGLEDRICVVTGSTAGIGLETARLLAAEGARVVVNGRDPDRVERARAEAGAALGVACDLSEPGAAGGTRGRDDRGTRACRMPGEQRRRGATRSASRS